MSLETVRKWLNKKREEYDVSMECWFTLYYDGSGCLIKYSDGKQILEWSSLEELESIIEKET